MNFSVDWRACAVVLFMVLFTVFAVLSRCSVDRFSCAAEAKAHVAAVAAADSSRAASVGHLQARAARAPEGAAAAARAERLTSPARAASASITRAAVFLPDTLRDTVARALRVKDSLEAAQAAVIAVLVLDTADLAAAARHALAADSARAFADSLSVERAVAAERREVGALWRGIAIGAGGAAVVIGFFILFSGAR